MEAEDGTQSTVETDNLAVSAGETEVLNDTQNTAGTYNPAVSTVAGGANNPTPVATMTSVKLEPPTFVSAKKSYESYKRQLKKWMLARNKQALVVALSLPEEDESNIKEKVF